MKKLLPYIISIVMFACSGNPDQTTVVGIQPLGGFDRSLADTVAITIRSVYGFRVVVLPDRPLPGQAYVNIKSPRFRADSLIRFLKLIKPDSLDYIMGLTQRDISTTKRDSEGRIKKPENKYGDWGVLGLGYRPGPGCVISTFRLHHSDKQVFISRLKKVSVHELGHNLGLEHCRSDGCVMQDARETIRTIDSVNLWLCNDCRRRMASHYAGMDRY